jgi:hypothetical protein
MECKIQTYEYGATSYYGLKEFTFEFVVKTMNHFYTLYASSEWEREIWMAAFKYIVISNL